MTPWTRFLVALVIGLLVIPLAVPDAFGQDRPRRSLFEVLFGDQQQQAQQPAQQAPAQPRQQQPAQAQPRPQAPSPPPAQTQASAPSQRADIEKSEGATRIAVMGDSLAVDLARAMERFYADDPETVIQRRGVGSSGFVRDDFFDWNATVAGAISDDEFDIAVVAVGINDRQALSGAAPLTEEWRAAYASRIERFAGALRGADKPVIWIELPPMQQPRYSADMVQISGIHRSAVSAIGGEWVETYERYMSEEGEYTASGPDLSGQTVSMRKADGIHFSDAGSDKLAFYVDRAIKRHHSGGGGGIAREVADPLAGTDAAEMLRPPFQGLGQTRLVGIAGAVEQIGRPNRRAGDLVVAGGPGSGGNGFDIEALLNAPAGRVDAFGSGRPGTGTGAGVDNPGGR